MIDVFNTADRFEMLDTINWCAKSFKGSDWHGIPLPVPVDWSVIAKLFNTQFDQLVEAASKPDRQQRDKALRQFWQRNHDLILAESDIPENTLKEGLSRSLGRHLLGLMKPASTIGGFTAAEKSAMQFDLTRVALALARYRADTGHVPRRFAGMVPRYLAAVPKDVITGGEFHYQRRARLRTFMQLWRRRRRSQARRDHFSRTGR